MKQFLLSALVFAFAFATQAQTHDGMYFQGAARGANGNILASTAINLRYSIHDSVANGVVVYQETFSTTTTPQGMFSLIIGKGTPVNGTFNAINWGTNEKFVQVELSTNGGSSYTDLGTTQMMSVPYALYAKTAESITGTITETDPIFGASPSHNITSSNITNWNTAYSWGNHALAGYMTSFTEMDTMTWKKNGNNIYLNSGNVGIGLNSQNPSSLLHLKNINLNSSTFWAQGYVTDNPSDPAIATIRGVSDGAAVFDISKAPGTSRNFAVIRMGVDGSLGHITSSNGFVAISNTLYQPQGSLDVSSTTGAFIVPRMTTTQRNALVNQINGSIIYNTTTNQFNFYENNVWVTK